MHKDAEGTGTGEPRGANRDLGAGQGCKRGENIRRNDSRHMHTARGTETIIIIWRLAGVGNVQVDGALHRERRWGAGVIERCGEKK